MNVVLQGKIVKGIGGFYYVETESGLYECRARGVFRKQGRTPLVGDIVQIQAQPELKAPCRRSCRVKMRWCGRRLRISTSFFLWRRWQNPRPTSYCWTS
ncbi:MAG: hypothetical protein ACLSAP_10360 [Oscillospiraceae bacterium]